MDSPNSTKLENANKKFERIKNAALNSKVGNGDSSRENLFGWIHDPAG
jgi:hypothetical protein